MGADKFRIDYTIFMSLCDTIPISLEEMVESIEYVEALGQEELRTIASVEVFESVSNIQQRRHCYDY